MNNYEECNDCKTQLEHNYKIKANGINEKWNGTSMEKNPQNSF